MLSLSDSSGRLLTVQISRHQIPFIPRSPAVTGCPKPLSCSSSTVASSNVVRLPNHCVRMSEIVSSPLSPAVSPWLTVCRILFFTPQDIICACWKVYFTFGQIPLGTALQAQKFYLDTSDVSNVECFESAESVDTVGEHATHSAKVESFPTRRSFTTDPVG